MYESRLASIKRHLEQLQERLTTLDSYRGWIYVYTEDGDRIFEDIGDGELQALIKRKLEGSIKFCEEQLKEHENEPKS
ncbi:hypothetical protein B7C51_04620 [Paenibacillus larvae subsp. pulvifaciens]|uniref:Uncharacterized protein n=1 Tax=Paenibacillus larvae subsp. pulvifaciens TaxID=1477 RepID=A0A1V0UQM7_9BACL|nr:hypothetical protein [Paenibacillus larvae]ARF67258.1 hypothetical protein B7C51_04620 [Paenibacillus larvae subsp. pulvifaciens]